jgi:hypothetical protein
LRTTPEAESLPHLERTTVSEIYDTGHDQAELEHEQYGNEHEHDAALHELHQAHDADHDQHYQHGRHEEFETPSGVHYEEGDFTNYGEHDSEHDRLDVVDAHEHDESLNYYEQLFAEQEHDHLHAFETGHGYEFPEHELGVHEAGHDAPRHDTHGHLGKAEQAWVAN